MYSVYFTHDGLLQTLQVLFCLLVAFVEESDRNNKNIIINRTIFLCHKTHDDIYICCWLVRCECPLLEFMRRETGLYHMVLCM